MLEASITRLVVTPNNTFDALMVQGIAEYGEDCVNFQFPIYQETDIGFTMNDLREKLASEFDLPPYRVDIKPEMVSQKIMEALEQLCAMGLL